MTPEQSEKLKKFGTNLKGPLAQQPPQQVVAKVEEQQAQTPQVPQTVEQNNQQEPVHQNNEQKETYLKLVNKEGDEALATLEIDLKTYRERGEEVRYVSILFSGLDTREETPKPQEAFFNITSKEDFNFIKDFWSKLNWED